METYIDVMTKVGDILGLEVEVIAGGWTIRFKKDNREFDVTYFDVGINSSLTSKKAKDKSLAYKLLTEKGVSCVEHFFFKNPIGAFYPQEGVLRMLNEKAKEYEYKVVLKPNSGGAGKNVVLVQSENELDLHTILMFNSNIDIALSPYYDYDTEYRVVVLDDEVLMGFGKKKFDGDFKHNLSAGATVEEVPENCRKEVYDLALKASKAIGLRFCTVDIINHKDGYKVMEINSSVTLKRVAKAGEVWTNKAVEAYAKALKKVIDESR